MATAVKRVEMTLPLESYDIVAQAAARCGVTFKNFIAMATMEKTMNTLERLDKIRSSQVALTPEGLRTLADLLEKPEKFSSAKKRLKDLSRDIQISEGLDVDD